MWRPDGTIDYVRLNEVENKFLDLMVLCNGYPEERTEKNIKKAKGFMGILGIPYASKSVLRRNRAVRAAEVSE